MTDENAVVPEGPQEVGSQVEAPPPQSPRRRKRRWKAPLVAVLLLLLVCTGSLWAYYLTTHQPITKVLPGAGVLAQAMQPHYLFSINGPQQPMSVAVTPKGDRIYVAESGGDRLVRAYDRDGKSLFEFAPPDSEPSSRTPLAIALDPKGQVYVAERLLAAVDIYDAGGNFQQSLAIPQGLVGAWAPTAVDFVGKRMFVVSSVMDQDSVLAFADDGSLALEFGGRGEEPGQLWYPGAVVVDARERLYVSDSNNGRVEVFDKGGNYLYEIPGFGLPRGMTIDAEQRLYVVDTLDHSVKVFDTHPEQAAPLFSFGTMGSGDGQFSYPSDIALDSTGRIYVSDRANNRVQVWLY